MSASVTKSQILSIYKQLLRTAQQFNAYNYKNYALRRTRDAFRENKTLESAESVQKQYQYAVDNLGILKRQVIIDGLYSTDKLVIEHPQK